MEENGRKHKRGERNLCPGMEMEQYGSEHRLHDLAHLSHFVWFYEGWRICPEGRKSQPHTFWALITCHSLDIEGVSEGAICYCGWIWGDRSTYPKVKQKNFLEENQKGTQTGDNAKGFPCPDWSKSWPQEKYLTHAWNVIGEKYFIGQEGWYSLGWQMTFWIYSRIFLNIWFLQEHNPLEECSTINQVLIISSGSGECFII